MLNLYKPKLKDLWFRQSLIGDKDTMAYNRAWGGIIPFPEEKWENWYNYYIENHDDKRFYRYLLDDKINEFIGEVAYHYKNDKDIFICNIIVQAKYRGKGYGTEGLNLLCEYALKNGITMLYDDIAADNPALSLFIKNGFVIDYQNDDIVMTKKVL